MCDSVGNSSAQSMVALRMKSSALNPFFASPVTNETSPQISSTSVNMNAVSTNHGFGSQITPRMTSPQNCSNFNLTDYQRLQFYDYATQASVRLRLANTSFASSSNSYINSVSPVYGHPAFGDGTPFGAMSPFARFDSRFRFMHEEPKPQHSYIGLIAMAILSSNEQKMVLSDIYQHILDNYPYFRNRGPGWRNSIRHNLSLNDCFIKAGRSANGKGHYWAIHPANIEDFKKGDFRRRKAQRKVRKHMGLSVPDDEDSPSPTPPPLQSQNLVSRSPFSHSLLGPTALRLNPNQAICATDMNLLNDIRFAIPSNKLMSSVESKPLGLRSHDEHLMSSVSQSNIKAIKRQFDVESLLAPDCDSTVDDTLSRADIVDKKSPLSECVDPSESNVGCSTPSVSSPAEYVINKVDNYDSNSSSPSISSTAEKSQSSLAMRSMPCFASGLPLSPSTWRATHLQSLQNFHQINAGLLGQSIQSVGSASLPTHMPLPWAVSAAALSNAQMAATLLGYASVANQAFDLTSDANKR